jgi:general secretion pathway protein E
MVGEIRDPQTASIAIQAALTGHLVLSTLHTSSAAGALVRLLDMGVEPYLLTSSVLAVAGQRLIRMLCTACRKRYMARDEEQALLGLAGGERVTLYRAQGCVECGELGYKGRTGIFELLVIEDATRDLILNRRPVTAIMATAQAAGIRTLQASARQKVLDGVTSVEEWQRLMLGELA